MKIQICGSDDQAVKALMRIYEYQTSSEKLEGRTFEHNGFGFTGVDSEILSSFADFKIKNGYLSKAQLRILKLKIRKYASQLVNISISKNLIKKVGNSYCW